jgi:hypothetical protein
MLQLRNSLIDRITGSEILNVHSIFGSSSVKSDSHVATTLMFDPRRNFPGVVELSKSFGELFIRKDAAFNSRQNRNKLFTAAL